MINTFLRDELVELIREHGTQQKTKQPSAPLSAYDWFVSNDQALTPVVLDQSPHAKLWRQVKRIAWKYPWGQEVIRRTMDAANAMTEDDMSEADLTTLLEELQRHDDRAMCACDDEDAPPAR